MNVREGVRRLGILLGISGGILGGFLGYDDARNLWKLWRENRQFASLMATPVMQAVAKEARAYPKSLPKGTIAMEIPNFEEFKNNPDAAPHIHDDSGPNLPPGLTLQKSPRPGAEADDIVVSVDRDGIKNVTVNKHGMVASIEDPPGVWVDRTAAPSLQTSLGVLLYPILGFLLPWGAVRVFTWVGMGFFAPNQ